MTQTQPEERVLGWDLLRGACALLVAFYHVAYWLGLAELPALGTYAVYAFFVLSGASLAHTYSGSTLLNARAYGQFMGARWLRLAPLYLLLCPVFLGMILYRSDGYMTPYLPQILLLNATFTFGLWDPVVTAILIGGWSLGIEFVYYLCFPFLLGVLRHRLSAVALLMVLVSLQWYWTYKTIAASGWAEAQAAYHQIPAFAAYFFGGCVLGYWRRSNPGGQPHWWAVAACAAFAALLGMLGSGPPGSELLGAKGLVLFISCFAVVHLAGAAQIPRSGIIATAARWLGDATYGLYLLHPILYFGLVWPLEKNALNAPETWALARRWVLLVAIVSLAAILGAVSSRRFEQPVRRWGRRILGDPPGRAPAVATPGPVG